MYQLFEDKKHKEKVHLLLFVIRGGKNILPYLPKCQEPETLKKKYQEPEPLGKKSRAAKKKAGSSALIGWLTLKSPLNHKIVITKKI